MRTSAIGISGVRPSMTLSFLPRAESAGLSAIACRVTRLSKKCRGAESRMLRVAMLVLAAISSKVFVDMPWSYLGQFTEPLSTSGVALAA